MEGNHDMSETYVPLTAAQILARLETLEQAQVARAAVNAPLMTAPNGIRLMGATSLGQILLNIPRLPQKSPFAY